MKNNSNKKKSNLQPGDTTTIAELAECTPEYASKVLNGHFQNTGTKAKKVLAAAEQIIKDREESVQRLKDKLKVA